MQKYNPAESSKTDSTSDSDQDQVDWDEELIRAVSLKLGKSEKNPEEVRLARIKHCLDEGANINVQDVKGNTVLHLAVKKDLQRIVKILREKGASTDILNGRGKTAITLAGALQKQDILNILKESSGAQGKPEVGRSLGANDFAAVADKPRPSTSRQSDIEVTQQEATTVEGHFNEVDFGKERHSSEQEHKIDAIQGIVEKETYSAAATLTRSWPGLVYQLKHLAFTLHCASQQKSPHFFLATEMIAAEKLDDVVLLYESDSGKQVGRFVQIKYTSNSIEMISAKQLLEADGNFSVPTYFTSWRKVKESDVFRNIKVRNMILCTNKGLDFEDLKRNGIHCENTGEPDKPFELKSKVKKTAWYKFLSDKESNEKLYRELRETSQVRRLAKLMVKCICDKKDMRLEMGSFRDYHLALVRDVFHTKTKEFHDRFTKNEGLSQRVGKFREVFLTEFAEMEKRSKTGSSEEPIWTKIHKLFGKLNFRQDFGKASKLTTNSFTHDELPDDDVDDEEISNFLDEFTLAVDQPNEDELNEILRDKIGATSQFNLLNTQLVDGAFQTKMLDWFVKKDEQRKGQEYFSYEVGKKFLNDMTYEISSLITIGANSVYCEQMKAYDVRFESEMQQVKAFIIEGGSKSTFHRILKLVVPEKTLLTALRIYDTLQQITRYQKMDSFIFTCVDNLKISGIRNTVMTTFDSLHFPDLLIVDCGSNGTEQYSEIVWNPLCDIIRRNVHKRMILITQTSEDLECKFGLGHQTYCEENDYHSLRNITVDSRSKLLRKPIIKFQGQSNKTSFEGLLGIRDSDHLTADELNTLLEIIDSDTLVELICKDEIQIGHPLEGLGDIEDYYINRTLHRHVVIREDITEDEQIPDLLAISGIARKFTEELVRTGEISPLVRDLKTKLVTSIGRDFPRYLFHMAQNSRMARNLDNVTFLNISHEEEQFEALCAKNVQRNIHWLEWKSGKYVWKKSQGNITHLTRYREANEHDGINDKTGTTCVSESELAAHDEPVIISDTAGMGKSTMLTNLARQIKGNKPEMLVLKIDLNRHVTALEKVIMKNSSYDLGTIDGAVKFLVEELSGSETDLSRKVFKSMIDDKRKVALIFDAFDEISPDYENTVIDLLAALVNGGIKKVFIATRPHTRGKLERRLNLFSHEIRPLSLDNQKYFLTEYWKTTLGCGADLIQETEGRIRTYAEAILKKLACSINDQTNKFTGVPLQTKLVAEIFGIHSAEKRESFNSCQEFVNSTVDQPNLPEKINLIDLYEYFVEKKFDTYFKKSDSNPADLLVKKYRKRDYFRFIDTHKKLALHALFNEDKVRELLPSRTDTSHRSPEQTNLDIVEERTGIITHINSEGRPNFGHRTYAEYFAATFLSDMLRKGIRNKSLPKIFVEDILLGDNLETMRAFINWLLPDEHETLDGESWKLHLNRYRNELKETVFHKAGAEGNCRIITFCLNCLGMNPEDREAVINAQDISGRTAVDRAVEYGYLDPIRFLIEGTNFKINSKTEHRMTPLHLAAHDGKLEVVQYLLEKGANLHSRDEDDSAPLHAAVGMGKLEVVQYLLEKTANVDSQTYNGFTPLHTAAHQGKLEVVQYLLGKGTNVDSQTQNSVTPLHLAALQGKLEVVQYLIENGADVHPQDQDGSTPLHAAAHQGKFEVLRYLIENGALVHSQDENGSTPLHLAAQGGKFEVVQYLIENGALVHSQDKDGSTPLHLAAAVGELKVVQYLLEKGANVHLRRKDGATPFHWAAQEGKLEVVQYLLAKGANVHSQNKEGSTPLHAVAGRGELKVVQYLLENGANVDSGMQTGFTPLHTAAGKGELEVVQYLLENGADVHSQDKGGFTALHVAAQEGELEVVQYLIEKRANVDSQTQNGVTPLHTAAHQGKFEVVQYLVKKGANVDSRTQYGSTPLHAAAQEGELKVVQYLLEEGAKVDSKTQNGATPLDLAAAKGHSDLVKCLLDKGAKNRVTPAARCCLC